MTIRWSRREALLGLAAGALGAWPRGLFAQKSDAKPPAKLDVLVVAPHSDDEAIGCTAVMLRAIDRKQRVGVVIVTAGDGFPKAAAALAKKEVAQLAAKDFVALAGLRQRHSIEAMKRIGIAAGDLMFLGYPDGGLDKIYERREETPWRQPHTDKVETYGVEVADYHTQVHDKPAPYTKASVLGDLKEILEARRPTEIYVTGEADSHGDHRATFWFVRDAARAAGQKSLWTFVVHGRAPENPPDRKIELTAAELEQKKSLLVSYQSGVSPVHDTLAETYAKPEERFWAVRLGE